MKPMGTASRRPPAPFFPMPPAARTRATGMTVRPSTCTGSP